ncbi:MAG: AMP-binding protein, partial [Acetobacteraceae bacterium]|nr:AMP-binding protein [Acetobacteraceae bacterium]
MIGETSDYRRLCDEFRWPIPECYNIGVDVCDRHADGNGRIALIFAEEGGAVRRCSFDALRQRTNRFANLLREDSFQRGDRLAIFVPQSLETAIGHIAAFKSGLISVPLFALFGKEALSFRLSDSAAKGVLTDPSGLEKLLPLRDRLPDLSRIYVAGSGPAPEGCVALEPALARASDRFSPVATRADDPAIIIYTSGTTGNP